MFYRHQAAKMYSVRSILVAFSVAELPFILWSSMLFCVCFYFLVGFSPLAYKFFLYYLFFTLNLGAFTFLGQVGQFKICHLATPLSPSLVSNIPSDDGLLSAR